MTGSLETWFACFSCNHKKSCDVKVDCARHTGAIFSTDSSRSPDTHHVSVRTSNWTDACETANQYSSNIKDLSLSSPSPEYQFRDIPGLQDVGLML
ncbi:hypothetical protein U0070_020518 [Myodes glareolus]|uniref:Uncharacterized protein n=1 Tax=Myodes glareolus TaxID=447135 RepID=A0AAW0JAH1_MYOGA